MDEQIVTIKSTENSLCINYIHLAIHLVVVPRTLAITLVVALYATVGLLRYHYYIQQRTLVVANRALVELKWHPMVCMAY